MGIRWSGRGEGEGEGVEAKPTPTVGFPPPLRNHRNSPFLAFSFVCVLAWQPPNPPLSLYFDTLILFDLCYLLVIPSTTNYFQSHPSYFRRQSIHLITRHASDDHHHLRPHPAKTRVLNNTELLLHHHRTANPSIRAGRFLTLPLHDNRNLLVT